MPEVGRLVAVIEADSRQAEQAFQRVGNLFDALRGNFAAGLAFGAGFAAVQTGLDAIGAGFKAAAEAAFGFNSNLEQSKIAFETMLGSGQRATAFMAEMKRFAIDSAFSLPQVQTASQRLLAMGTESGKVIPLLRNIGAAAIGLHAGTEGVNRMVTAIGQMQAKTKVSAEEMMQMTEMGVPAWDLLARGIGRTVPETMKLAEQGRIASSVFIQLFQQWSEGRFSGIIERYAQTWEGATGKIKDLGGQITGQVFQPLTQWATRLAVQFADWLESPQAARWAAAMTSAVQMVTTALQALWTATQPVRDALSGLFDRFADLMGIPQTVAKPAEDAGKAAGNAFGQGMAAGITQANPLETAIKSANIEAAKLKIAADDIQAAYGAAIDPLKEQAAALEKQADFAAELRDLALEREASDLRFADRQKDIDRKGMTRITFGGRVQYGADTSADQRALDIEKEQAKNRQGAAEADIKRRQALQPLLDRIKDLEAAEKAHLAPIQEQLKAHEKTAALLNIEKQEAEQIAGAATTTAQAITTALSGGLTAGNRDQWWKDQPGKGIDLEAIKAKGVQIGQALLGGIGDALGKIPDAFRAAIWDNDRLWALVYDTKKALGNALSPDGLKSFASWAGGFLDGIDQKIQDLRPGIRNVSNGIARWLIENAPNIGQGFLVALREGMLLTLRVTNWATAIGTAIGEGIGVAIGDWLRSHWADVIKFALMPPTTPPTPIGLAPWGQSPSLPAAPPAPVINNITLGDITVGGGASEADLKEAQKQIVDAVVQGIVAAGNAA